MRIQFQLMLATACLVTPLILFHEIGHFITGMAVGVPSPQLDMAGFTHGPAPWLQSWEIALIAGSGPAVTLAFAVAGAAMSGRRYALAATVVSVAACSRLLELLPYALSAAMRRLRGSPPRATTFDEDIFFHALGLPGDIGLIVAALTFATILYVLLRRHRYAAPSLVCGGMAGWVTWTVIINA